MKSGPHPNRSGNTAACIAPPPEGRRQVRPAWAMPARAARTARALKHSMFPAAAGRGELPPSCLIIVSVATLVSQCCVARPYAPVLTRQLLGYYKVCCGRTRAVLVRYVRACCDMHVGDAVRQPHQQVAKPQLPARCLLLTLAPVPVTPPRSIPLTFNAGAAACGAIQFDTFDAYVRLEGASCWACIPDLLWVELS